MDSEKEKTKQVNIRLPKSLYDYVIRRAVRYNGGNFTMAIIDLLSRARETIVKQEGYIAERELLEWAKEYEEQKREAEGSADTGTDPPRSKGD